MSRLDSSTRTASELLFETYLQRNGLTEWEFEPNWSGNRKKPDYLLRWNGKELLFEVKERRSGKEPVNGHFNPYEGIRRKIKKACEQFKEFKEFKDECCSLVIANQGDPHTLLAPEFVFGAMLGDPGFTFPILNADHSDDFEEGPSIFLPTRNARMVTWDRRTYKNTTIAAIIVLERVRLRNAVFERLLEQAVCKEELDRGRPLSPREPAVIAWKLTQEWHDGERGPLHQEAPRVRICENPGATLPFPRDVFCGPYDERWAIVDEYLAPVYAGVRVREIEASSVSEEICFPT